MKYKLTKEYPGSPKLNTICIYNNNPWSDSNSFTNPVLNPKYYPEFWQPVVEKDYEILSLVASEKNPQHKKGSKFLHNKDYKFKNMTPTEFWDIYSVKRISDNKIFTIGDFYEDLIIEKMFMSVAGDILTTYYKPKIKQPLFTTEDDVNIFKGDKYCAVFYDFKYLEQEAIKNYELDNATLRFSTKEKAEEYILLNKPCLSINDVNVLKNIVFANWDKTLKDLVKSKI